MKMGLIGPGFTGLGYEMDYKGPFTEALVKRLTHIIKDFKPDEILTSGSPGAETIWAWVGMGQNVPITCVLSDPEFGKFFEHTNKEKLEKIKEASKLICVGSKNNIVTEKYRDDYIIDRSDIMIIVWDKRSGGRIHKALQHIEEKDRETILIDSNAINK
jgi:uncharacterized phage-like protein YoqJ